MSLVLFAALVIGCGNEKSSDSTTMDAGNETVNTQQTIPPTNMTAPTPPPTAEPAQNADGVWHYTCPNGCEGGAGAAGPCPGCGAQLTHNSAYHANVQTTTTNPAVDMQQAPPPTPEPAQNADGVWHYVCPNGCAGGAGAAGPCPNCGAQLTHNAQYH